MSHHGRRSCDGGETGHGPSYSAIRHDRRSAGLFFPQEYGSERLTESQNFPRGGSRL